jgi:quercetin dioxygenase-like cupin family protein
MTTLPFHIIDWTSSIKETSLGETGQAEMQIKQYDGLRIRKVSYSAGYVADHWCKKGHIVHCIEGSFVSELENGEKHYLTAGDTYVVSDDMSSHKSISENGVKLLIIDGDFLK